MDIIYEDKDIIVVDKPAGIAVQTANIAREDIVSKVKNHICTEHGTNDPYLGIVHRLDQPVRGLLVFALNRKAAAKLSSQISEKSFVKRYHAIVNGIIKERGPVVLEHYLIKDKDNLARIVAKDSKGAKRAVLSYKVKGVDEKNDISFLDIRLMTGRYHQIRAQLSAIGHPIVNDIKYGGRETDPALLCGYFGSSGKKTDNSLQRSSNAICLCACYLSFIHPSDGSRMEFGI